MNVVSFEKTFLLAEEVDSVIHEIRKDLMLATAGISTVPRSTQLLLQLLSTHCGNEEVLSEGSRDFLSQLREAANNKSILDGVEEDDEPS